MRIRSVSNGYLDYSYNWLSIVRSILGLDHLVGG
jgi:hypothetical protein